MNKSGGGIRLDIERITRKAAVSTGDQGQKIHYSKFHIMWSSNVRVYDERLGTELVDQMSDIFVDVANNKPQDFVKFKIGTSKVYEIDPGKWNDTNIIKYRIRYVIEKGTHPKGGRVHLHAILFLVHYTNLQIEARALKKFLCDALEEQNSTVKGCYLHIKWIPSDMPLENYIGKSPFSGTGIEGL